MREAVARRLGVEATSLWLTERVWEPELAADLAQAGVEAVLVDDRHFLVAGFGRSRCTPGTSPRAMGRPSVSSRSTSGCAT